MSNEIHFSQSRRCIFIFYRRLHGVKWPGPTLSLTLSPIVLPFPSSPLAILGEIAGLRQAQFDLRNFAVAVVLLRKSLLIDRRKSHFTTFTRRLLSYLIPKEWDNAHHWKTTCLPISIFVSNCYVFTHTYYIYEYMCHIHMYTCIHTCLHYTCAIFSCLLCSLLYPKVQNTITALTIVNIFEKINNELVFFKIKWVLKYFII